MSDTQEQDFDYTTLLNKGIKAFGHQNVLLHLNSFYNFYAELHPDIPIISIGSGNGIIEFMTKQNNSKINWICIDIDSNPINFPTHASQHMNQPFMKVDYNSVDQLIINDISIIGKCILFLNWCLPNDSIYDFEAIIKLKPLAVFSIYELYENGPGAAGGEEFFNWMETNKNDYTKKEQYSLCPGIYHDDYDELLDIRMSWWQCNTLPNDEDYIQKQYPCLIRSRSLNCSIM